MKQHPSLSGHHVSEGDPNKFNKLGRFAPVTDGSWAKLPTYYYELQRSQAPMTEAQFDAHYGATVDLFAVGTQDETRQTNAATGRTVNEVFCAVGASIVAVGEGEAFSVPGAVVPLPVAAGPTPEIGACIGAGSPEEDYDNAILQHGSPIWTAIEKMFMGYRFIMQSSRFTLVDELLMDIGMSPAPPEFIGAGDMLVSGMPAVADANQVLVDTNQPIQFVPQNVQTVGEESIGCVGAPLVPAMKGHPRIVGMSKRVFCFNHPICFFPGMTFQAGFVQTDATLINQARNALTVRNDTPGPRFTNAIGGTGLRSNVITVPHGTLHMGLILKGFALQPKAALDYLTAYLPRLSGSWSDLYSNNIYLGNLILQAARGTQNGVRGVLAGTRLDQTEQEIAFNVLKKLSGNAEI